MSIDDGFVKLEDSGYRLDSTAGFISVSKSGIQKLATFGTWNEKSELRLDIRCWYGKDGLGKGVSLNKEEVHALRQILDKTDFGK